MLCRKGTYVCVCTCQRESVSNERFHVSSTVTVRTSAIHVSPGMSTREAPSANRTNSQSDRHTLDTLTHILVRTLFSLI